MGESPLPELACRTVGCHGNPAGPSLELRASEAGRHRNSVAVPGSTQALVIFLPSRDIPFPVCPVFQASIKFISD